jgi:hypothetical protein
LGSKSGSSTGPVPKDGGTLRSIRVDYMTALSKGREVRAQWQRAAELLLPVADFSRQVELALFYDAKLDLAK